MFFTKAFYEGKVNSHGENHEYPLNSEFFEYELNAGIAKKDRNRGFPKLI